MLTSTTGLPLDHQLRSSHLYFFFVSLSLRASGLHSRRVGKCNEEQSVANVVKVKLYTGDVFKVIIQVEHEDKIVQQKGTLGEREKRFIYIKSFRSIECDGKINGQ